MNELALAVAVPPWAEEAFTIACIAAVGVLFPIAVVAAGLYALRKLALELKQLRQTVETLEKALRDFRATTLPPVAVALGTIGAALAGGVNPWVGAAATAVFACTSFYFANLAKTEAWHLRRYCAVVVAVLPFVGAGVGYFVVGAGVDLSPSKMIGSVIFGVAGLLGMTLYVLEVAKREVSPG